MEDSGYSGQNHGPYPYPVIRRTRARSGYRPSKPQAGRPAAGNNTKPGSYAWFSLLSNGYGVNNIITGIHPFKFRDYLPTGALPACPFRSARTNCPNNAAVVVGFPVSREQRGRSTGHTYRSCARSRRRTPPPTHGNHSRG